MQVLNSNFLYSAVASHWDCSKHFQLYTLEDVSAELCNMLSAKCDNESQHVPSKQWMQETQNKSYPLPMAFLLVCDNSHTIRFYKKKTRIN